MQCQLKGLTLNPETMSPALVLGSWVQGFGVRSRWVGYERCMGMGVIFLLTCAARADILCYSGLNVGYVLVLTTIVSKL